MNNIDHVQFAKDFLNEYLAGGFANMPKREVDLLVLRLLITHTEGWCLQEPPSAFALSQTLRAKRGRLRSLLDELAFREPPDHDATCARLRTIILRHESDIIGDKVRVQIEDGYLREYLKSRVQSEFGIVDTSFSQSILSFSADKFLLVVGAIVDDNARNELEAAITRHCDIAATEGGTPLMTKFVSQFVEAAGKEIGTQTVRLGFAALTGGGSQLLALVDSIVNSN